MSSQAPDRDALLPPSRPGRDGRSYSNSSVGYSSRAGTFMPSVGPPGSFSSDLKSTVIPRSDLGRPEFLPYSNYRSERNDDQEDRTASEKRQAEYRDLIEKETKIKMGSENLLEALHSKNAKQTREQRSRVENELQNSNRKIAQLKLDLEAEIQRSKDPSPGRASRLSQLFRNAPARSPSIDEDHEADPFDTEAESPTFVLAEILQSLDTEGLSSDYYVEHANNLVELFKRHPTLKYDLVWSIFGLRVQSMLLSESRDVIAAGYRMMRYAITDRKSLSIMRSLHTDQLVILSLVKENKASTEREQALKFVRAFLDVKDGVHEISRAVVRVIVAVAEHHDDRLRNICILTLSEILIRSPALVNAAGGMRTLTDALAEGHYYPAESLAYAFLHLLDTPERRKFLRSGHELEGPFASFTDITTHSNEERLKPCAKVIAAFLKTWSGLTALSKNGFLAIRSLAASLYTAAPQTRDVILELIYDVLRIKPPSWSSAFLAGRRLTTYGRVVNMRGDHYGSTGSDMSSPTHRKGDLIDHFSAALLAVFVHAGLPEALVFTLQDESDASVKRRSTLLLGEILNMADKVLPSTWTHKLQVLPGLFNTASLLGQERRHVASRAIYQIDSVNRTLFRTAAGVLSRSSDFDSVSSVTTFRRPGDASKGSLTPQIDEGQFRAVIMETQVLNTVNYLKWKWDLIEKIIEGPLLNPKRLDEAIKASKFVKRLMGFYRPFKKRFADIRNTKPNQRYVRIGCALFRTLLRSSEGAKYLAENKVLRQIGECLAQVDRLSGYTAADPMFSADRLSETLSGGYFALLGVISSDPKGLAMLERWRMINMFYHIVELQGRDDLIKNLLGNLDYTLDSHLRIILSKTLTSASKEVRIFATRILRKYATKGIQQESSAFSEASSAEWAISLLTTQLYDPEIEVCEAAIHILEETCDDEPSLEYVVRSQPALDHLGEIGAPLLLRFLSTSVGYYYLDGLDYITQEMDDWFLGRNDAYVALVEASLLRAMAPAHEGPRSALEDSQEPQNQGIAPPHFYRELTRTTEGCRLLESKGHFDEFVTIIKNHGLEDSDAETIVKVKGCLWAVGNIGCMELGAPFLESSDVVARIVDIAERSKVMSMRGTAFFVLGLISKSLHGQEILAEYKWDSAVDDLGNSIGICLPADLGKLFSIQSWANSEDSSLDQYIQMNKPDLTDDDPINSRILSLVNDLGNTVLTKGRANELHAIKAKKAPGFQQVRMFHKVMGILEQHHFQLPALRFAINLFNKDVMRRVVLDEDEDTEVDVPGAFPSS